jgi:hypothetical protein
MFFFDQIGVVLRWPISAKSSASARWFSFSPEPLGDTEPPELPCIGRRVLKKLSGPLFYELLGSTVFIRLRATGTRDAPGAILCRKTGPGAHGTRAGPGATLGREVGTRATVKRGTPGATLSQEVGTGATVTHGAPKATLRSPGAALRREVGTGAVVTHGTPRAALCREVGAAPGVVPSRSIVGCFR